MWQRKTRGGLVSWPWMAEWNWVWGDLITFCSNSKPVYFPFLVHGKVERTSQLGESFLTKCYLQILMNAKSVNGLYAVGKWRMILLSSFEKGQKLFQGEITWKNLVYYLEAKHIFHACRLSLSKTIWRMLLEKMHIKRLYLETATKLAFVKPLHPHVDVELFVIPFFMSLSLSVSV